jgi:ubiquinone/menaquinone biosynthesis C-methylase UbiE
MEPIPMPAAIPSHPLFNEMEYLEANQDVKEASAGKANFAWTHFVNFGYRENRPGVPDRVREIVSGVMNAQVPVPPPRLIDRVHGTPNAETFDKVGRVLALDIYGAVAPFVSLDQALNILDFGCGCGRVTRFLRPLFPAASIQGADIDAEAIGWCAKHCQGIQFSVGKDLPPLSFESASFDLICAISVFTHLPEEMQFQWLGELRRITKKTGLLVITVSSDRLIKDLLPTMKDVERGESGFYYLKAGNTDGLPDYYQAAWHTPEYIRRVWSKWFTITAHVPAGANGHQDLLLCRPI